MAGGLNALARLQGKVDANGALVVALDGSSPITGTTITADAFVLDRANSDIRLARAAARAMTLGPTTGVTLRWATADILEVRNFANSAYAIVEAGNFRIPSTFQLAGAGGNGLLQLVTWNSSSVGVGLDVASDATFKVRTRAQTGDASVTALNYTSSGYMEGAEMTAPAAPAANGYRLFAQDNGGGKTQLMVLFATGAAQQVAIQP